MQWNWGRIAREDAVAELAGKEEGTFLVRMSTTDDETYSISVVQDGQVRHIRVLADKSGFSINKADKPCQSIADLIDEKMGEKIKSRLGNDGAKETVLLKTYLPVPDDDVDASAFLTKKK